MDENIKSLMVDGSEADEGEQEYYWRKDRPTFWFNPTDPLIICRIHAATQKLSNKQDEYKRGMETAKGNAEGIVEFVTKVNDDMLSTLAEIFPSGLNPGVFGGHGVYAYNRDGVPVWVAFVAAVMDRMSEDIKAAQAEQTSKVEKLLSKYKRK